LTYQLLLQVLDTPEPLRNLSELIAAQLEFHKKSYEILSELAPVVDQLQVEQEVSRRDEFYCCSIKKLIITNRPATGRAAKELERRWDRHPGLLIPQGLHKTLL
jgi:hypothetical protein